MTSHATDPRPVRRVSAVTASGAISQEDFDPVVVEAPLSIAVDGKVLATTMRTPGHDEDLAVGWLGSETDLTARGQIVKIERRGSGVTGARNRGGGRYGLVERGAIGRYSEASGLPHLELLRYLQR